MLRQVEVTCWEIMQCNRQSSCSLKKSKKKNCWEHVESHADHLFHICIDCLVHVAHQKDSTLGHDGFSAIMAQRKAIGIQKTRCSLNHAFR